MNLYTQKDAGYFTHARRELISLIPRNPEARVLEIGAGAGDTLLEMKRQGLARYVAGVELMEIKGSTQNHELIDKWVTANVEETDLPFEKNSFDVIICGDVLEHLIDPWTIVEKLTDLLKVGGSLVTSIPNIQIKNALYKIYIKGDFGYTRDGTFDRTHMRFFCKKNMMDMLTTERLQIATIKRDFDFKKNSVPQIVNLITFGLFERYLTYQYLFQVKRIK